MDEWKARWCPVPGEPIANNLQLYHHASKLFLNTIPLHTMLRNGDACDDPDSVSSTISSASSLLSLGHAYAELGVLRHCPDVRPSRVSRLLPRPRVRSDPLLVLPPSSTLQVNFLFMLYSTVFLVKVRVSNSRFAQLVDPNELEGQLLQLMKDCQEAAQGDHRHAAMTCYVIVRALGASWKALETGAGGARSRGTSIRGDEEDASVAATATAGAPGFGSVSQVAFDPTLAASTSSAGTATSSAARTGGGGVVNNGNHHLPHVSLAGAMPPSPAPLFTHPFTGISTPGGSNPFSNPFAASSAAATPVPAYAGATADRRPGTLSGAQTPSAFIGSGMFDGAPLPAQQLPTEGPGDGVDNFLNDTHFFGSVLIGRGASGFFDWPCVPLSLSLSLSPCLSLRRRASESTADLALDPPPPAERSPRRSTLSLPRPTCRTRSASARSRTTRAAATRRRRRRASRARRRGTRSPRRAAAARARRRLEEGGEGARA